MTEIVSVIEGARRFFGLSGRSSADTEKVSERLTGGAGGGVVEPISVIDGGLGEGVLAREGGGESTSSSGEEHDRTGELSQVFTSFPPKTISSPLTPPSTPSPIYFVLLLLL